MSILGKLKQLIENTLNEQLKGTDNPESRIHQIIRDLEKGLYELRQSLANAMANQHMSQENVKALQKETDEWQSHAERALKAEDEALARKALEKKIFYKERIEAAEDQLAEDASLVKQLRDDMQRVENRLHEARNRKETLLARSRSVKAREKVISATEGMRNSSSDYQSSESPMSKMDDLERDLNRMNAEQSAKMSLSGMRGEDFERELKELKMKDQLDTEMAELKARLADGNSKAESNG